MVIENDKIVETLAAGQAPSLPVDRTLDVSDCVLVPGLVNTHHHFYQTLTRALPDALNLELFPWLKTLYPYWAGLDDEMISVATELALAELMLSGCTTASDHHYVFSNDTLSAIDAQVSAAQRLGARVTLTRGSMSLGQKSGGLPPESVVQSQEAILLDSERLVKAYHDDSEGSLVQLALAPCSPFSVTPEIMKATADMANTYQLRTHTHLAETLDEEAFCLQKFGMRTVEYLEHVGWLNSRTWLAHGIHFNDEEIATLGKAGVGIAHCPSSNMMLASGSCKVKALEAAGSPVGLGVDGSASNDCSNMIMEVRQAMYLQRLQYGSANISHLDALRWGTQGGAAVLGRSDIGTIDVGKQADLALFNLDELRFSGGHDPLATLILCGAHKVKHLFVAGQQRVANFEHTQIDTQALMAKHKALANKLIKKRTGA